MSAMKEIVRKILTSYVLVEQSRDPKTLTPSLSRFDAAVQVADGDEAEGWLLFLFGDSWSNDIVEAATFYGYRLQQLEDGKIELRDDVPPAPGFDHIWDGKTWVGPSPDEADKVVEAK